MSFYFVKRIGYIGYFHIECLWWFNAIRSWCSLNCDLSWKRIPFDRSFLYKFFCNKIFLGTNIDKTNSIIARDVYYHCFFLEIVFRFNYCASLFIIFLDIFFGVFYFFIWFHPTFSCTMSIWFVVITINFISRVSFLIF